MSSYLLSNDDHHQYFFSNHLKLPYFQSTFNQHAAKRPSLANLADVNLEPEDCVVVNDEQKSNLEAPTAFPEQELFCGVYEPEIVYSETKIFISTEAEVILQPDDHQIKSYTNLEYPALFTPPATPEELFCGNYEPRGLPDLSEIANSGPGDIMIFTATEDVMQPGLLVSPEIICTKNELKPYLMILNEYEAPPAVVTQPEVPIVETTKDPPKPKPKPVSEVLKRKRELNRVASANCKRRKIENILKLEENVRDIENGNSAMERMIETLKKEVYDLEFELSRHVKDVNCPIEFVGNRIVMN